MSVGESGRVVVEVDPEMKRQLYEALSKRQITMKDWFTANAQQFIRDQTQMLLDFGGSSEVSFSSNN